MKSETVCKSANYKLSIELIDENNGGPGVRLRNPCYGSINFPLAALIAASVRVAAPSLPRALSV